MTRQNVANRRVLGHTLRGLAAYKGKNNGSKTRKPH